MLNKHLRYVVNEARDLWFQMWSYKKKEETGLVPESTYAKHLTWRVVLFINPHIRVKSSHFFLQSGESHLSHRSWPLRLTAKGEETGRGNVLNTWEEGGIEPTSSGVVTKNGITKAVDGFERRGFDVLFRTDQEGVVEKVKRRKRKRWSWEGV